MKQKYKNVFPKWQILDSSKLKEFAVENFNFGENGRKFSERVKTVGKGDIGHYKQFLIFPQSFQKTCTLDKWKQGLVWERVEVIHEHPRCFSFHFFLFDRICHGSSEIRCMVQVTHIINPFPNNNFSTLPNWKYLQMTILKLMKMEQSSPKG